MSGRIFPRQFLTGLEKAIIDGSGLDQPVGMRRNPNSALDPQNGYSLQGILPLEEITPETYGPIITELTGGTHWITAGCQGSCFHC